MRTIILISFLYSQLICQYPNFTTPYIQTIADVIERYDNGTPKIVKYFLWEYDKLVLKQTLEFSIKTLFIFTMLESLEATPIIELSMFTSFIFPKK